MTLELDPDRAARAAEALSEGAVEVRREAPGTYTVTSFSRDRQYTVRLNGNLRCDCPDAQYNGATCKHLLAVALTTGLS